MYLYYAYGGIRCPECIDYFEGYPVSLTCYEKENIFIAEIKDLPGCAADGESKNQALFNLKQVKDTWVKLMSEMNKNIPLKTGSNFKGEFTVEEHFCPNCYSFETIGFDPLKDGFFNYKHGNFINSFKDLEYKKDTKKRTSVAKVMSYMTDTVNKASNSELYDLLLYNYEPNDYDGCRTDDNRFMLSLILDKLKNILV